jgi:hypothetical protein
MNSKPCCVFITAVPITIHTKVRISQSLGSSLIMAAETVLMEAILAKARLNVWTRLDQKG